MNDKETSQKADLTCTRDVQGPKQRKPYSTPKLTQFGALAALTKAHSGPSLEGVSGKTAL
jgi:hypothetical protein